MSTLLKSCIYNLESASSEELRRQVEGLNFVRLVAEVSNPEELATLLQSGRVNVVFFHLDPKPAAVVEVIEQASVRFPELALVAISHQTAPDAILAPMRAGCDQFVCEPIEHTDLATAVARAAAKRALGEARSRCICVTGANGGSGATSLAANLAMEIGGLTERHCALVDLDLQFGDLSVLFDCEPRFTLYDLATASGDIDRSVLVSSLEQLPCHVALLARPQGIQEHELFGPDVVHRVIEMLKATYENVVVDIPARVDAKTLAAFAQAQLILIVCQMVVPSIRNAKRYFEALVAAGVSGERIQVVVNRAATSGRVSVKDLEDAVKKPVFATIPNDYAFVAQSIDFGQPIAALDAKNPVRSAIRAMAERIVNDDHTPAGAQKQGRRGLLSRLMSK